MAISDTTSSPNWSQLFQRSVAAAPPPAFGRALSDSTVVTTTAPNSSAIANIEGRVGKSSRRRSRASRRAPTTLLNTDTTNFRAMVQQFTGIPSAPFPAAPYPPNITFGLGFNDQPRQTSLLPFMQQQQQQQHFQEPHQYQVQQFQPQQYRQPPPSLFAQLSTSNTNNANTNNSGDVMYHDQHSGNPRASLEALEGFFMDGASESSKGDGYLL